MDPAFKITVTRGVAFDLCLILLLTGFERGQASDHENKPVPSYGFSTGRCEPSYFSCADGLCLPSTWICDGENDCFEGEDEGDVCQYEVSIEDDISPKEKRYVPFGIDPIIDFDSSDSLNLINEAKTKLEEGEPFVLNSHSNQKNNDADMEEDDTLEPTTEVNENIPETENKTFMEILFPAMSPVSNPPAVATFSLENKPIARWVLTTARKELTTPRPSTKKIQFPTKTSKLTDLSKRETSPKPTTSSGYGVVFPRPHIDSSSVTEDNASSTSSLPQSSSSSTTTYSPSSSSPSLNFSSTSTENMIATTPEETTHYPVNSAEKLRNFTEELALVKEVLLKIETGVKNELSSCNSAANETYEPAVEKPSSISKTTCPHHFQFMQNKCIQAHIYPPVTWYEANAICSSHNSNLLTIHTKKMFVEILSQLRFDKMNGYNFWIGANNEHPNNRWKWIDGREITNVDFWISLLYKRHELSQKANQCAFLDSYLFSYINENSCSEYKGFICETALTPSLNVWIERKYEW